MAVWIDADVYSVAGRLRAEARAARRTGIATARRDSSQQPATVSREHRADALWFFFFQAEDGIRDLTVTGVQTCALPIWTRAPARAAGRPGRDVVRPRRPVGRGSRALGGRDRGLPAGGGGGAELRGGLEQPDRKSVV